MIIAGASVIIILKKNNQESFQFLTTSQETCIYNNADGSGCKDCCDCLSDVDEKARTICRDECAVHDFSENFNIIEFEALSILGSDGDYSQCTDAEDSHSCKSCCEGGAGLSCGDHRHCRTACNEKFGDDKNVGKIFHSSPSK